jgi:3-methylcrotonyl-CoA carboxylase alpha subunit
VEHPITEAVLGLDLVEWQVRIAAGEPLTLEQEDLRASGHAVECRIYAEDPYNNFAPSAGKLTHWLPPSGPGLRLDSGVAPGQEISTYYDPMLAKLIAWGPDRPTSLRRMELALSNFPVLGLVTNIPFLREVIRHPHFQNGQYDITFLENTPAITQSRGSEETRQLANALAAWASASNAVTSPRQPAGSREPVHDSPWRAAGHRQFP